MKSPWHDETSALIRHGIPLLLSTFKEGPTQWS